MRLSLFLLVCAALGSNVLRAGTLIYGNYDPAVPDYNSESRLSILTADAVPFTVALTPPTGFSYALSDIEFAGIVNNTETLNTITASLYDSVDGLPGNALESFQLTLDPQAAGAPQYQLDSVTNPLLLSGQQYWFVLSDPSPFDLEWYTAGNNAEGVATLSDQGWTFGDGYSQGALLVNGILVETTTPEPGTLLALGSGLVLLGARKAKKYRA
jgi:hypothetical protein